MSDDTAQARIAAKILNQRSSSFGRKTLTFIWSQDRIPDLALRRTDSSCERAERTDQNTASVRPNKADIAAPAELILMLSKLHQQKVQNMGLPVDRGPVSWNDTLNEIPKTTIAILLGQHHFRRYGYERQSGRDDVVTRDGGHLEIS